jgi:hypothetical protein
VTANFHRGKGDEVKRFSRREDQLEAQLRARRREPNDAFVRSVESGIDPAPRPRALRLAVAGILTAVALAAFGASGGLSYAAKAVSNADLPGASSEAKQNGNSPAANQYGGKTTICHQTSSETNPFVLITVSDNALDAHKEHGDTLPAADGSCPGPPIP